MYFKHVTVGLSPFHVSTFCHMTTITQFKHDDHMLLCCWRNCSDITWTIL